MVKKIAVEEHFLCPGFEDYWAPTVVNLPANKRQEFLARLTDFGEMRPSLLAEDPAEVQRHLEERYEQGGMGYAMVLERN